MQESAFSTVELTPAGVATLTLVNLGAMNILHSPAMRDLTAVLGGLRHDPRIRVLVMRGSGEKAFIGGADINEMARLEPASAERFITVLRDLIEAVRDFPVPVIGRMSGWCIGAGLELAAACDLRIASPAARFSMPEVRIGIPSVIQAVLLSRLIGEGNTRLLLLTARSIDAQTALRWGLVNEVAGAGLDAPNAPNALNATNAPNAPNATSATDATDAANMADALDAVIGGIAAEILACAPGGIRSQKQLLRDWEAPEIAELMGRSIKAFGASYRSDEPARLMQDFLDRKRG